MQNDQQTMQDDQRLLRQYGAEGSEAAFETLVARYVNLVYATALRRLDGDAHLAQDAAQLVFTDLARKARSLPPGVVLAGWLHWATRYASTQLLRAERRRRARERQAIALETLKPESTPDWGQIRPWLDEALDGLNRKDRDAVLLRVVEGCSLAEVGAGLGSSEEAARKRVDRALEKLRARLVRRGVPASATALAAAISAHALPPAPAGLAATLGNASLAGAAAGGGTSLTVLTLLTMTKIKAGLAGSILLVGLTASLLVQRHQSQALARLRGEHQALLARQTEQQTELDGLRVENQRLAKLRADTEELERLRRGQAETLRLRGEVARLRQERRDTATQPATDLRQWTSEELTNAGRATPADALQTFLWSGSSHNAEELQRTIVPDADAPPTTEAIRRFIDANTGTPAEAGILSNVTYRATSESNVAPNEVQMDFCIDLPYLRSTMSKRITLRKDSGEWKVVLFKSADGPAPPGSPGADVARPMAAKR